MCFRLFKKKEVKEPERNPFWNKDRAVLSKGIRHQGIGGKTAYVEFEVKLQDIMDKAIDEHNPACFNFMLRRPNLFYEIDSYYGVAGANGKYMAKPKAYWKSMKYYYVKVWQSDGKNGTYLGYIVCSDEIDDYIHYETIKEEAQWI